MAIKKATVQFKQWTCIPVFAQYDNGRIAIRLFDADDNEPVATATTNLVDVPLQDNHVHIKEWGENKGMTKALIDAGIVRFTGNNISVNQYADHAKLCELL